MDIRFDDEGVSADAKRVVGTLFDQGMAGGDDDLVDRIEDLRGEQTQIVLERLQAVAGVVRPVAVAEHLADRGMLVGQLLNPIIVGIQAEPQHAQDQDLPLLHAGTALVGIHRALPIGAARQDLGENRKHLFAHLGGAVDVLQAPQQPWDVVARAQVKLDPRDVLLAKLQLRVDNLSHQFE